MYLFKFSILLILPCGIFSYQNATMEGRIVKGVKVGIEKHSYAVFLYFQVTSPASCGASLIMVQAVITAAHCVIEIQYNRGRIDAYFGSSIPKKAKVVRKVAGYEIHPKYNERTGTNNMVILFLDRRVPLGHTIKKIPLAHDKMSLAGGKTVFSVGWGRQVLRSGDQNLTDPQIQKLRNLVPYRPLKLSIQLTISHEECSKATNLKRSPALLCTVAKSGYHHMDDAGNGLMMRHPSQVLVGVLSFVADYVSVYGNVQASRRWIIKALANLFKKHCKQKG